MGVLMNTRGIVQLVVLNIGVQLKVISPVIFAMFVLMATILTIFTSPILYLLYTRHASSTLTEEVNATNDLNMSISGEAIDEKSKEDIAAITAGTNEVVPSVGPLPGSVVIEARPSISKSTHRPSYHRHSSPRYVYNGNGEFRQLPENEPPRRASRMTLF